MKKIKKSALKWIADNSKSAYLKLIFVILASVFISVLGVWLALASKNVIDVATGHKPGSFAAESIKLFGIVVLQLAVMTASGNVKARLSGRLIITLKQRVFSRLLKKDWQSISAHHSGELLNRINSDVGIVVNGVSTILPNVFSLVAKLVSAFVAMFFLDRTFAFVAIAVGPPVIAAATLYSKKMKSLHKKTQETEGKSSAFMQESLQNMLMIKSFGSEDFMAGKSAFLQKTAYKLKIKRNTISILASSGLFLVFSAVYYATLAWSAHRLSTGLITVGTMTAFLQLINQIQSPFMGLSSVMPQVYSMIASAERVIEIEELPDEENKNSSVAAGEFEKIKASGVTFGYMGSDAVLEDVEFEINKNEFVAVTGESGAGKSTLIKLLLGIISPVSGTVEIEAGGKNYSADKNTRGLFAYVPQGNMILSGTIRDNIRFSRENVTDAEIEKCARLADIWEFISRTEKGLDTVIGERGLGLSEGQVQRLAIARALIYDAPILLLDEATSALDAKAEETVLDNIRNMTDKTCIIISHKKTALRFCNKTLHVSAGKIFTL